MNLEERWLKFKATKECEITDCNRCSIDFADEAVKAREKQIADELEPLLNSSVLVQHTRLEAYIAQLRNGETK